MPSRAMSSELNRLTAVARVSFVLAPVVARRDGPGALTRLLRQRGPQRGEVQMAAMVGEVDAQPVRRGAQSTHTAFAPVIRRVRKTAVARSMENQGGVPRVLAQLPE